MSTWSRIEDFYRADRFFTFNATGPTKEEVIADLMRVRGIGENYANELYEQGIRSVKDLIATPKIHESIRLLARYIDDTERELSVDRVKRFLAWLETLIMQEAYNDPDSPLMRVEDVIAAGAHRRGLPSSHDIDVVIVVSDSTPPLPSERKREDGSVSDSLRDLLSRHQSYLGQLMRGDLKYSFLWKIDGKATITDVILCASSERGSALIHATGPSTLNILLRKRANAMGMTLSEHGLFKEEGDRKILIHSGTEEGIFEALKLPFIEAKDRDSDEAKKLVAHLPDATTME